MTPHKKYPRKQLENFSNIFLQIGLVLVLFVVHIIIENVIAEKILYVAPKQDLTSDIFVTEPFEFKKYVKPQEVISRPTPKKVIPDVIKKGDPPKLALKPTIVQMTAPTMNNPILGNTDTSKESKKQPELGTKVYDSRMVIPLFKGCKDISYEENKACFDKKMKRFVHRKFDSDIGSQSGLQTGNYKIYAQFIIDENGDVIDVKVRAPNPKLQKEAEKMILKLPKFVPGKMGYKNVRVRYILPINFQVD